MDSDFIQSFYIILVNLDFHMVKVSVVTFIGHFVVVITFDQPNFIPTILLTDYLVIFLSVEMLNDSYHPVGTLEHPSIFLTEVGPCCYV
jgi:hypothetical protein